ncbi:hypothetical protein BDN70DRAFT_998775 [Pholiota conissans]|uniref:Uncharacterized protein n=1 Tax=Pholiota conissans TaxID=109636 RepID=A0A9P5YKI1_9AGAR|nr:hypothetical protein BDN70DRAFT_998775 [Pholiota conissans]
MPISSELERVKSTPLMESSTSLSPLPATSEPLNSVPPIVSPSSDEPLVLPQPVRLDTSELLKVAGPAQPDNSEPLQSAPIVPILSASLLPSIATPPHAPSRSVPSPSDHHSQPSLAGSDSLVQTPLTASGGSGSRGTKRVQIDTVSEKGAGKEPKKKKQRTFDPAPRRSSGRVATLKERAAMPLVTDKPVIAETPPRPPSPHPQAHPRLRLHPSNSTSPYPSRPILSGVFGALALLVVLISGFILLRRCMDARIEGRRRRRPEVAASRTFFLFAHPLFDLFFILVASVSTKPSKAPLTPFFLQSSKQPYHALPRYAYGADLQADYTPFLISPPPPLLSSPNVPFVTSRPSTMSMAKHSLSHNASQAQGLSDHSHIPHRAHQHPLPPHRRPCLLSLLTHLPPLRAHPHPPPQPHTHQPPQHQPPPPSSTPSSSSRPTSSKLLTTTSHPQKRDGSAVSLDTSLAMSSSSFVAARRSTTTNAGRRWEDEDEDTLPPGYVLL